MSARDAAVQVDGRPTTDPDRGLTAAEVEQRVAEGKANDAPDPRSRSLLDIIKANTLTWFNLVIGSMWAIMLLVAPFQDSLFGFAIVANTLIGIVQEYRASRVLARLSLIGAARPTVRRDGLDVSVAAHEVVLDDVIVLSTGDQLVVDGIVLDSAGLEIDESLLTGEADPVGKAVGDQAMSGSFVVAGSGRYVATAVGRASFASGLTEQAKKFHLTNSELRTAISGFIRSISFLLLPIGALLLFSQAVRADIPIKDAIRGTIAGMVTMVPEGLVLLTSIAMAVAVIRLAAKRVLVQDMPAVEVLARVDVVCVDKTGTLTQPGMHLRSVIPVNAVLPVSPANDVSSSGQQQGLIEDALGALASAQTNPNPTLQAIAEAHRHPGWQVQASVPFSSARKWSSATFAGRGTWVLGAPEMLLADDHPARATAEALAADGARVLALGTLEQPADPEQPITGLSCAALVVIDQRLRPDAAQTVQYFLDQDVTVKVISGDNATTVGAIAAQAGVPGAADPVDARELPESTEELAAVMAESSVFGRVTPLQKQAMVDALHRNGATVAMTGDGVNDVLALKSADLGIAMGSGSSATRAVAQLVLLEDRWAVMPSVVAEGRRVLGNIERVSDVFLTKSFYAIITSVATAIFAVEFPFLPRHLTVIGALTIGIPGFFLALMPNTERFRPGFFKRVLLFSAPAGMIAAACAFTSYGLARSLGEPLPSCQSAATVTLFIVATAVLLQSARPLNLLRIGIVALMIVLFLGILFIPFFSQFFALSLGPERYALISVSVGLVGAVLVWVATLVTDRWRRPQ
ncbi:MAG: cation-translocating P-type ATPase [Actinomycetales bacterium]|nr:cation-translocating P-type ATPase [Actinomycetales bacterium]